MDRNEAIKEVRSFIGRLTEGCQEAIRALIPELRESEDERIRKGLISYLKIDMESNPSQAPQFYAAAIAYLEKQKEPSMSAEEVLIKAGLKPYKDGNKWCILAGDNIQEGICGFGDTIDEALYQFLMEVCDKQKEQKPAETPSMLELLRQHLADTPSEQLDAEFDALKEYTTDKPAEWSEEDEKMIKQLIYDTETIRAEYEKKKEDLLLRGIQFNNTLIKDCDEQIVWLKSLLSRPKPSGNWKPSKYLLSLVKKVADGEMLTGVEQMAMGTLHEELKKLSI